MHKYICASLWPIIKPSAYGVTVQHTIHYAIYTHGPSYFHVCRADSDSNGFTVRINVNCRKETVTNVSKRLYFVMNTIEFKR